ncbi:MAG: hypothetical protein AAFN74_27550, partial [Myxococcota bacterium]
MTKQGRAKDVFDAVQQVLPDIERTLKDRGRVDGISVSDRIALQNLLERRPELLQEGHAERLGLAVSAVLARSSEESELIKDAWRRYREPVKRAP